MTPALFIFTLRSGVSPVVKSISPVPLTVILAFAVTFDVPPIISRTAAGSFVLS